MNWFEGIKNWFQSTKSKNWSEITGDFFQRTKNVNWYESARNLCESGKNLLGRAIDFAKENVEVRHFVIGGVALVLVVAVIRGCGSGGGSNGGKTMKAPGGNGRIIYRDGFERNPRGYFSGLRNKKT